MLTTLEHDGLSFYISSGGREEEAVGNGNRVGCQMLSWLRKSWIGMMIIFFLPPHFRDDSFSTSRGFRPAAVNRASLPPAQYWLQNEEGARVCRLEKGASSHLTLSFFLRPRTSFSAPRPCRPRHVVSLFASVLAMC